MYSSDYYTHNESLDSNVFPYVKVFIYENWKKTSLSTIATDFKVTAEELEAAITPKTKLLMFSSPCNPSGTVYTRDELTSIAKMLEKYPDIYIISDEIYEHINFTLSLIHI